MSLASCAPFVPSACSAGSPELRVWSVLGGLVRAASASSSCRGVPGRTGGGRRTPVVWRRSARTVPRTGPGLLRHLVETADQVALPQVAAAAGPRSHDSLAEFGERALLHLASPGSRRARPGTLSSLTSGSEVVRPRQGCRSTRGLAPPKGTKKRFFFFLPSFPQLVPCRAVGCRRR